MVINSRLIDAGRHWLQRIVDCFVIKATWVGSLKEKGQILRSFDHLREAGPSGFDGVSTCLFSPRRKVVLLDLHHPFIQNSSVVT